MKIKYLLIAFIFICLQSYSQETQKVYLSGKGIDNPVEWDFYCTKGMNSEAWHKIPVPSCWEPRGFGIYTYGWGPNRNEDADEQGIYKCQFKVPKDAKGKQVNLVFDGVMTEATAFVNRKQAGEKHIGGYSRFKYDISSLVKYGQANNLRVEVNKKSENATVNKAEREGDFWTVTGIHRPVYLEIVPKEHIQSIAVDARQDGYISVDISAKLKRDNYTIRQTITDLSNDNPIGGEKVFSVSGLTAKIHVENNYADIKPWNCESPNLYMLKLELIKKGKVIHQFEEKIGFRTVEVRPNDGIYVNGVRVILKGVNYHSWHPDWGRATSKALSLSDALLMKEMNMNAVRMSHYPHDQHFYDICDSLGLFVFDELGSYHHAYDFETGKRLLKEMMTDNVNHPCIIAFANGNEGGYDLRLEPVFKELDPQKRFVYHPTHYRNGFDSQHYKSYGYAANAFHGSTDIFVQTEFLHALYDGGGGAGLSDYWEKMRTSQNSGGGFIWAFLDEGVVRHDLNDSIDCSGNMAPDGIVGPYREKEGSFYTIRDVWSPIQIKMKYIPKSFNGRLKVGNQYLYRSLKDCHYKWSLQTLPLPKQTGKVIARGEGVFDDIKAGLNGYIQLELPGLKLADVLVFEAYGIDGKKVNTWSWPISFPADITNRMMAAEDNKKQITYEANENYLHVSVGSVKLQFDLENARLAYVENENGEIPLKNGPVFTNETEIESVHYHKVLDSLEIVARLKEKQSWFRWRIAPSGLVKFSYQFFNVRGLFDIQGVSWDFPESPDLQVEYLGRGPYRVWSNRKRGLQLGVFKKTYNDTKTGSGWVYPEFKGYHSDLYWAIISNSKTSFKIFNEAEFAGLRLFTPKMDVARNCQLPPFPDGNISLMNAISPIGTKVNEPAVMGPESNKHHFNLHGEQKPVRGDVWFDFRN